ncbi:hypothetical protein B0H13DRAFT_2308281 [Mycena leptocephala]|nr:hypothetical protein B0H13DRAFT_2308281 [Mycena leptocephala]
MSIAELDEYSVGVWHFGGRLLPASLWTDPGAYLNETDTSEPDWKTAFYERNYDRLLAIKLYGSTAVVRSLGRERAVYVRYRNN